MNWIQPRGYLVAAFAAALVTGLLLYQPAGIFESYDVARMHLAYKHDLRAALLAGEIPWWNPYTALGRPFLADIETATCYPASWLVLPFGVSTGILLIIWLHLALAIEGMRRFTAHLGIGRGFALVAGISFALSGALLGRMQAGQLQLFCVVCLWPWVWLSAVQLQDESGPRPVVRAALWLTLSLLAGSPQVLWCGLVPLGALLIVRAGSLRAAVTVSLGVVAAGLLAAGLSAIQLLPFAELVQQGNRPIHDAIFASRGGATGSSWLTLLVPPGPWLRTDWEFNLHSGALVFLFAGAAVVTGFKDRNVRALAAAALLGGVLAFGDGTFILPTLAEWVPGFAGVRYPSRYALGGLLALTPLAFWWLDQAAKRKCLGRVALGFGLGLHGATLVAGLYTQGLVYLVPLTPTNQAQLMADLHEAGLPRDGAPPRVALPSSVLLANAGGQCGVSTVAGFNNPALARTWTTLYLLADEPLPDFHRAEVKDDIIVKLNEQSRNLGLSAGFSLPGNSVRFFPPLTPRAFLSFSTRRVGDWKEAVALVRQGHDFEHQALIEDGSPLINPRADAGGHADIVKFDRNRIVLTCVANAPGLLVLAEAWYPSWTARLDESPRALAVIPVNGWMRGVTVPAGNHRVTFDYQPTRWWLGVGISILSGLLAFILWQWPRERLVS